MTSAGITTSKATAANNAEVPLYYTVSPDKKDITIKNAKAITGAATYNIQFEYTVTPAKVATGSMATIQASCTLLDASVVTSNELTYTFNTTASLDSMSVSSEKYYSWSKKVPLVFPSDAPSMDLVNYRYVSYIIQGKLPKEVDKFVVSQPYKLTVDLNLDNGGKLFYVGTKGVNEYVTTLKEGIDKDNNKIEINVNEMGISNYLNLNGYTIYAVAAYPVDPSATSYKADVTLSLDPVDGIPARTTFTKSLETSWADYNFKYPDASLTVSTNYNVNTDMGMFALDHNIEHNLDTQVIEVKGGYYPKPDDPTRYGINIISDLKYLADSSKTAVMDIVELTSDDVYLKSLSLMILNSETNRFNGEISNIVINDRFKDETFKVYYRSDKNGAWDNVQTFSFSELKPYGSGSSRDFRMNITPPEGMVQLKLELPPIFSDAITATVNVQTCIKKTSPAYAKLRVADDEQQKMTYYGFVGAIALDSNNQVTKTVSEANYSGDAKTLGLAAYDKANGQYIVRPSNPTKTMTQSTSESNFKILQYPNAAISSTIQDTENQAVLRKFIVYGSQSYIEGFKGNTLQNEEYYQSLLDAGLPNVSLDQVSYYMLLPRGATLVVDGKYKPSFDGTSSGSANSKLEVNVISNNYKGTHCQLVELKSTALNPGNNRTKSWTLHSTTTSGSARNGQGSYFDIDFYVSIPNNEAGDIDNSRILGAFLIDDKIIGTGYADTGENLGAYDIKTDDGNSVFYDLGNKGIPDTSLLNTMYATSLLNCEPGASAYVHGLTNFVRPNDTAGLSKFSDEATVIPGQTYEYRLKLTNGQGTDLKNVVLFNNFGQGTEANTKTWRGTFQKVDLSLLEQKGIDPVVYYTTIDNASYFTIENIKNTNVPSEWSTNKPANNEDIKGIAIDISKSTNGADFVMKEKNSLSVYITMKAPSSLPTDGATKELNFATYSATIGTTSVLPDSDTSSTNNTVTKIVDAKLLKSTSTNDRLKPGDTLTYTLEYENSTDFDQVVLIQDTAPKQTHFSQVLTQNIANPTIKIGIKEFNASEVNQLVSIDETKKEIEYNLSVPAKTNAKVTFDVVIDSDAVGEIKNIANAVIENYVVESNEVINTLVPVVTKTGAPYVFNDEGYRYNISYTNQDGNPQKVVISDTLPLGTTFAKDNGGNNLGLPTAKINDKDVVANWKITGDVITWTFDNVPAKSRVDVSFEVKINDKTLSLENIANVTIDNETISYESNKVETTVEPLPDLIKSYKNLTTGLKDAVSGDTIRYECTYKNESTQSQTVIIKDAAPTGTILTKATDSLLQGNPNVTVDGIENSTKPVLVEDELTWTLDNIQPNQIVKVTFDVIADKNQPTVIDNTASLYINNSTREFKSNLVRFNKTIKDDTDEPNPPINPDKPNPPINPDEPNNPVTPPVGPNEPNQPNNPIVPPVNPDKPNQDNSELSDMSIEEVNSESKTPETGDSTNLFVYIMGFGFSALYLMLKINKRKKIT